MTDFQWNVYRKILMDINELHRQNWISDTSHQLVLETLQINHDVFPEIKVYESALLNINATTSPTFKTLGSHSTHDKPIQYVSSASSPPVLPYRASPDPPKLPTPSPISHNNNHSNPSTLDTKKRGSTPSWASKQADDPSTGYQGGLFKVIALSDFESNEQGDLSFKQGDIIHVTEQVDENWYEGQVYGRVGIFPKNFVKKA